MNAPDKAVEIRAAVVAFIAFLTTLWGWVGWAIIVWLACVLLDYATGTWAAKSAGEWSSEKARSGLWHKLGEIVGVACAAFCDLGLHAAQQIVGLDAGIQVGLVVTPLVLLWYTVTELGSIAENAEKLGAPITEWLKRGLTQYRAKLDTEGKTTMSVTDPDNSGEDNAE
mgnify:CR=1 FL=1